VIYALRRGWIRLGTRGPEETSPDHLAGEDELFP
jgi:hypothetical protein